MVLPACRNSQLTAPSTTSITFLIGSEQKSQRQLIWRNRWKSPAPLDTGMDSGVEGSMTSQGTYKWFGHSRIKACVGIWAVKLSKNWVYQNWGPFVTEPRAVATGLLSRLTSSTMKGPVATARGSVTISCSWHGQPSSRTAHNDSRYGDPFIASVQDDTRHLDELAEGCWPVGRSPGEQESVREAQTDCGVSH